MLLHPSNGGNGILGHLVHTPGLTTYQTISHGNVAYLPPVAPVPLVIPQEVTTAAMIAEMRRTHNKDKATFKLYNTVDAALKKLLAT